MVYLGVDLHRKISHVVALDGGEVVLERRFDHSPAAFRGVFGELAPEPVSVVFEATYGWSWFADLLADAGIEAHHRPIPSRPRRSARAGSRTTRSTRGPSPTCCGPTCCPRPGSPRPRSATPAAWSGCVPRWCGSGSRLKSQVHAICADAGVPVLVTDLSAAGTRAARVALAAAGRRLPPGRQLAPDRRARPGDMPRTASSRRCSGATTGCDA